jgi:non-specific serine/threonine protein kinase
VPVSSNCLGLRLTPKGQLKLERADDAPALDEAVAARLVEAFEMGSGAGLLRLGTAEVGRALPPVFNWWRDFASRYAVALCGQPTVAAVAEPSAAELASLVLTAPMMSGAEYLSADILAGLWAELGQAFKTAYAAAGTDLQSFLATLNPAWNLIGRVHFNLAENRRDPDYPFAFMATYTTSLSANARAQHKPLGEAMRDYAGAANRGKLLSLLEPVQRAAGTCDWLRAAVDAGEIFHPLRWTVAEAGRFLASVPDLENAGIVLRMPAVWRANRPPRPKVSAVVGARPPSTVGLDGLLDFDVKVTLDGSPLSDAEIDALLSGTDTLALLRGQWVEIDRDRLARAMDQFRAAQALAARDGLTFSEALRLLSGVSTPARPGRGSRTRCGACARRTARRWTRAPVSRPPCGPIRRTGCGGSACFRVWASAPAWPTTWAWARRSRFWLCF